MPSLASTALAPLPQVEHAWTSLASTCRMSSLVPRNAWEAPLACSPTDLRASIRCLPLLFHKALGSPFTEVRGYCAVYVVVLGSSGSGVVQLQKKDRHSTPCETLTCQ